MRNFNELLCHIERLPQAVPFVGLDVTVWEAVREEAREYYEDRDEELRVHPTLMTPNFMVEGIPVIPAGHA